MNTTQDDKNNSRAIAMAGDLSRILTKIEAIEKDITEIKDTLKANYVTQDQFAPVKNVVYGMVTLILVAVVGAIVTLVVQK